MKVNTINVNFSKDFKTNLKTRDIANFGITKQTPNQATNLSFKGHTEIVQRNRINKDGTGITNYNMESSSNIHSDVWYAIRDSKSYHPDSYMEEQKELGKYYGGCYWGSIENGDKAMRVYFADPMEIVNDDIKSKHVYVVYDNEPAFPSLEKIYKKYHSNTGFFDDLNEKCKRVYEYHDRLKQADNKALEELAKVKDKQQAAFDNAAKYKQIYDSQYVNNPWMGVSEGKMNADYYYNLEKERLYFIGEKIDYYTNRIKNSTEQQKIASELYSILDEAGELFMRRDVLVGNIADLLSDERCWGKIYSIDEIPSVLSEAEQEYKDLSSKYRSFSSLRGRKPEAIQLLAI